MFLFVNVTVTIILQAHYKTKTKRTLLLKSGSGSNVVRRKLLQALPDQYEISQYSGSDRNSYLTYKHLAVF